MSYAIVVGLLVAGGTALVLKRGLVRITLGFILLSHAANLVLVVSGGTERRGIPIVGYGGEAADPLPQAFALTAIVIGFGVTAFLLALAYRMGELSGDDDTERGGEL